MRARRNKTGTADQRNADKSKIELGHEKPMGEVKEKSGLSAGVSMLESLAS
jgi:hypothetical protein